MTDPHLARARRVLEHAPVLDGHNDLPWRIREHGGDVDAYDLRARTPGMTDLTRLRAGCVGAQFWAAYTPGEPDHPAYAANGTVTSTPGYARLMLEQNDVAQRVIGRYPELTFARTAAEARAAMSQGKLASLLGIEGGHA